MFLTLTHVNELNECDMYNGNANQELIDFTEQFMWGFVGDICAKNYKPFLDEAVAVINTACSELPEAPLPEP